MKRKTTPLLEAISISLLLAAPACAVEPDDEVYDDDMEEVEQAQSALKATGYYCSWTCDSGSGDPTEDAGCAEFKGDSTFTKASLAVLAIKVDDDACGSGTMASDVSCSANAACS
jgi:hypothetical protein